MLCSTQILVKSVETNRSSVQCVVRNFSVDSLFWNIFVFTKGIHWTAPHVESYLVRKANCLCISTVCTTERIHLNVLFLESGLRQSKISPSIKKLISMENNIVAKYVKSPSLSRNMLLNMLHDLTEKTNHMNVYIVGIGSLCCSY